MAVTIATSEDAVVTNPNFQRKLVRLSDGTLYCVYHKMLAGQFQIYVKKSTNNGLTWTDETRISTYAGMDAYNNFYPSIAVDGNNHLHVVFYGKATGYTAINQIWYAKYDENWATPVRISTYSNMSSHHQRYPSIAVDGNNHLHVVFYGKATGYTTSDQIWYAKYTDSWATPVRISTYAGMDAYNNFYPSIAVDGNNHLHVVWAGKATGYTTNNQIWYAKYTDSWATPVRISTYAGMDTNTQGNPCITVDGNNYLHVVWEGKATGYTNYRQVWYAKYDENWATPVRISTYSNMSSYIQRYPSIAVDNNNYLHAVWKGMATGFTDYDKVWYAEYTTSWATPECLQTTGRNQYPNLRWSRYPSSNQVTTTLDYVFVEGTASPYNIMFDYVSLIVGWTGKVSGVTDPAKVMGVEVANIAKVKGVA